ncbi:nucleotidyltransferase domain-containing protein [Candidatus Bathyarchaeota archaeon]|nr:MAG: nucleotidyltransferase domain-containing protein [Candidatus Bathyarchaeota archaeon]
MSRADPRLVGGALVGSTAGGGGDRWSDLDLTFGLADGAAIDDVLADWTARLVNEFQAVHLFDLPHLSTIYRVFLLPNNLQVDLSFTPGNKFLGKGLRYDLLFGNALERDPAKQTSAEQTFGLSVVYLLHAHACIARGRMWEAEYCISAARDQVLSLACLHKGLKTSYGRGFDDLPPETLESVIGALVGSLEKTRLIEALGRCVGALLQNSQDVSVLAGRLEPQLRELKSYQ